METNLTESEISISITNTNLLNKYMRLTNLTFSCTGVISNFILLIILLLLGRHQCTTYFILIIMTICDLLYCIVYTSILLTIDYYLNIINHQILCPLSFFLTPFTFTGSTLLLFICLLHLITDYVRRYDTVLGQIGGRLSVVFIFAFIIIRSVLGSTSIELISDSSMSHIQHCTIDINTSDLVSRVQKINHIFAEVTDILVYFGWIIMVFMYFISVFRYKNSLKKTHRETNHLPNPFVSVLMIRKGQQENQERLTNKQRHNDISLIILSISCMSIPFYLPVMINKFTTMDLIYRNKTFLTDSQIYFLQSIQQTTHLFCLTIRFIPYFIFDKRIRSFLHRMIGMKIERKKSSKKKGKYIQKYICRCQCSRRQQSLELNQNPYEHKQIEI
ncbi:unnamed protein product [Adineta steineri]|uniref:G-protein coupled receptors family 1 profile domain-containing protein n=1 Tax=Adineta steineri TaxID=433720 RepID=A0A814UIJ1_9BILA|nr:unnamed protein product [Adineta steineri]CAF1175144.1 unnamed protein product [Adineta steineri]CAF1291262.1 unnamed protein product [Adineta steineri]CAF1504785.1 unnamed protein product [Adineta steineri]